MSTKKKSTKNKILPKKKNSLKKKTLDYSLLPWSIAGATRLEDAARSGAELESSC